jgi:anti-sigma-K factor RskA
MNTEPTNNSTSRSAGDHPAVSALLRSAYAAPTDAAYWAGLEQRVLARLRESGPITWWAVFSEWRSAGLVAAAAALLITGAAIVHEQRVIAETRELAAGAALFTVFDSTSEGVGIALRPSSVSAPRGRLDVPERYLEVIRP